MVNIIEQRPPIKNVMVIGSGVMGGGIALRAAQYGYNVTLVDINEHVLQKSMKVIHSTARLLYSKLYKEADEINNKLEDTMKRIRICTSPQDDITNIDIVIEVIPEILKIKCELFEKLDKFAPSHTIFVSNTSTIPIHEIDQSTQRQDRFAGLHFFNPVAVSHLVELIRTSNTSELTFSRLQHFVKNLRLHAIFPKDKPSFIVNRLLIPFFGEALAMYSRGDATFQQIDEGITMSTGMSLGPFKLADLIGLDTWLDVVKEFQNRVDGYKMDGVDILKEMVKKGNLGRKSGQGFYKYKYNSKI